MWLKDEDFRKGISSLEQKLFNLPVLNSSFYSKSLPTQRKVKGKSKESISKG